MEEKDDWTCGREGDRHPFTQTNLQDEFIPPIKILRTYIIPWVNRPFKGRKQKVIFADNAHAVHW